MFGRLKQFLYNKYIFRPINPNIGQPKGCTRELFEQYSSFCDINKNIVYSCENQKICINDTHKCVGGVCQKDEIFFTPNKANAVLMVKDNDIKKIGQLSSEDYKWTGECIYNNKIYFFPRKQNNMLVYDGKELSCVKGLEYNREHHYGGILWENMVIQSPRSSSHFLIWNLDEGRCYKEYICSSFIEAFFRYNCSILHPNGFIYFFPEDGRVIKMNPENMKWIFVGDRLQTMIFDAKVAPNGNIYGFSINNTGIVKLDVKTDSVTIIHKDIFFGAYGTKLGVNGNMYSIPGSGSFIWEFEPITEEVKLFIDLNDNGYAKYAGGCTTNVGEIYFAPAFADNILKLIPNKKVCIPEDLYNTIWVDNY